MAARTVLSKWIGEFCAPVVVTVVTAEAESISFKTGLLLHELLSSFGHLDSLNTTVRTGNSNIHVSDAHIRFERVTELKPKTGELIEEMMNKNFEEFDISRLPTSAPELKSNPPTGWNSDTEQVVMRSMAFSEYEMLSHPIIILTVVATSDVDQVACMQELVSPHHTPVLFSNGQYDPQIHRVFMLLHDASGDKKYDAPAILKKMQSKFTYVTINLLTINSFPVNSPNLQQPDMWSRFIIPKYFPQHAPSVEAAKATLPVYNGNPVLGCRLSMEDFINLQSFCINLFNNEIVPCIERRLNNLHKLVSDARKGMKNFMKGFWRKPREESDNARGGVKYRYDKVESQILLLADLSFAIKDFETAISMYKLVRDDYRSDKSQLHLAHSTLMLAACYVMTEPNKTKDLHGNLESLSQVLSSPIEVPHANAYFALLGSEMYVHNHSVRAPLEAAKFLLQAAANLARFPLLSSLLTERAASYFLQAGQPRRYIFNIVYAGNRMMRGNSRVVNHAAVCFASAMLILDKGHWGDLKAKLSRSLAQYLKLSGREGSQRALLFMLKLLSGMLSENNTDVGNNGSLMDAVNVFSEIIDEGAWGSILIGEGWSNCHTRDILLGVLPISPMNILANDISKNHSLVVGLSIPSLHMPSTAILNPMNASESSNAPTDKNVINQSAIEEMILMLEVELQWVAEQELLTLSANLDPISTKSKTTTAPEVILKSLADKFAEAESDAQRSRNTSKQMNNDIVRVPLGEEVLVGLKMTNKLPIDLPLTKVGLIIEPEQEFVAKEIEFTLLPEETSHEVILSAKPLSIGQFTVDSAKWSLSEYFSVRQPLRREGALLQKSLQQRVRRERGEDKSMLFEVIPSHPLIKMSFEGLSAEVLQGQLLKSVLILKNEGAATACDIYIKLSQPSFVLYTGGKLLPFFGKSSTVLRLDPNTIILPGQEIRLDAWLRVTKPGLQTISLLASYKALRNDGTKEYFVPGQRCRSSFISIQTRGIPAVGVTMRLMTKASSSNHHTLIAEMANFLRPPTTSTENVRNSIGQLDLGNFQQFIDVDECGVKVVGMQMLGSALPFAYQNKDSASTRQQAQLLAAPTERVVGCYPVKLVDNCASGSDKDVGNTSWLLPLLDSLFLDSGSDGVSKTQLLEVMEQFLCISFSADQFEKDVEEARRLIRIADMEADESGPRTISQVRKERQRAEGASRIGQIEPEADTDSDGDDSLTEVTFDAGNSNKSVNNNNNSSSSTASTGSNERTVIANPVGVKDIAFNEALNQSVTVALVWVCCWEGKIRWGMQNVSNLSFINNQAIVSSAATANLKSKNPSDYLMVGFAHQQEVKLLNQEYIHVMLNISLRCVHDSPLFVNIEALNDDGEVSTATDGIAKQGNNGLPLLEKVSNSGFKWTGQTKFSNICIPAHGSLELKLFALVYKTGVFDLKRFNISTSLKKNAKSYYTKQISGHCLIKVVNDVEEVVLESV